MLLWWLYAQITARESNWGQSNCYAVPDIKTSWHSYQIWTVWFSDIRSNRKRITPWVAQTKCDHRARSLVLFLSSQFHVRETPSDVYPSSSFTANPASKGSQHFGSRHWPRAMRAMVLPELFCSASYIQSSCILWNFGPPSYEAGVESLSKSGPLTSNIWRDSVLSATNKNTMDITDLVLLDMSTAT